ncbi:MAG TPA: LarC family nickel insertion protein [Aurantimonas coralicida]|uniref:LarC family nickel insertion protein n=2 Tax=root TaxID=1 RepID=A0A9C9NEL3_9HYPH|nr:LarC family nickel insertion protein [Aurantimonas coralicida]HEU00342.1 LarC family nickel insertion protein [Aurantimonas coralicida]
MAGHGLHLHLDPVGGAAGDMFVGAMLHALPALTDRVMADVEAVLPAGVGHAHLAEYVASGITSRRFALMLAAGGEPARHGAQTTYKAMRALLESADLSDGTSAAACAILYRIAEAEARVHNIAVDRVRFHEIADWDALMDVTAAGSICAALDGASFSLASLPLGGGLVDTAHGKLPVPAPATALILEGYDWHDDGISGERVTPTGAAILAHVTGGSHGARRSGRLITTGSGAGIRVMTGLPNILRVSLFDTARDGMVRDCLTQLACDIDDMTGEELGAAVDELRDDPGVVDVILLTGQGKKSRPVVRMELLVRHADADHVATRVFDLTSTLGLRRTVVDRLILPRYLETGPDGIRRKRSRRPGGLETLKVESDDLACAETLAARRLRARGAEAG